jgi:hypothetical protein
MIMIIRTTLMLMSIVMMTNMFLVTVHGLVVFTCIFEHIGMLTKIHNLCESHIFNNEIVFELPEEIDILLQK